MKQAISILMRLLFALTILYPSGAIITACFGYTFELISISAFAIATAAVSVAITVLDYTSKNMLENNVLRIILAVITPLSLINSILYIFESPHIWAIASVLLSAGCCCYLTVKYGRPLALKNAALILSALMIVSIGFYSFISLILGNIGQNTVVQTVESPNGKYSAQVIDSDQGALGGDTFVDVYQECGVDMLLFKVEKKPQRVYFGEWGEFENMQIHWKTDNCLVINSVEYEIE